MKIGLIINIFCLVAILVIAGSNLYDHYSEGVSVSEKAQTLIRPNDINYFKTKCSGENKTIKEVMYCAERYVEVIYKYNITDDNIKLDYYDLITKGGDCKDWSEFWMQLGEMYGYNVRKEVFAAGKNTDHATALIFNEEGYCFAANDHIICYEYSKSAGVE